MSYRDNRAMTGANTIPLGGGGIKTGSRALGGGGGNGGSLLNPSYLSMPNVKHERKYTGKSGQLLLLFMSLRDKLIVTFLIVPANCGRHILIIYFTLSCGREEASRGKREQIGEPGGRVR
jgi:hypothetical protein